MFMFITDKYLNDVAMEDHGLWLDHVKAETYRCVCSYMLLWSLQGTHEALEEGCRVFVCLHIGMSLGNMQERDVCLVCVCVCVCPLDSIHTCPA